MAYLKLYIPLSLLMTSALSKICSNDSLKYHNILFSNGAGCQSLDESIFPPENALSESLSLQAYHNWLTIIDIIASPEVEVGWYEHHSKMLQDQKFSASFEAWCDMDKQLHTQLIDNPFIVDPTCSTYIQLFECAWMDGFLAQVEKSQHQSGPCGHSSFHGGHKNSSHNHGGSARYNPYHKEPNQSKLTDSFQEGCKPTLCLFCRATGH